MTERNPIADITVKLEARLTERLVNTIRPLLAGRSAVVQRAVLAALAAEFAADKTGEVPSERPSPPLP